MLPPELSQHIRVDSNGCWIWTASHRRGGYASTTWKKRTASAYRVTYHLLVDPTFDIWGPRSLGTIDHLCEVPACVNPEHLEVVSHQINTLRGWRSPGPHRPYLGVTWVEERNQWAAADPSRKYRKHLGYYESAKAAYQAYVYLWDALDPQVGWEVRRVCGPTKRPSRWALLS